MIWKLPPAVVQLLTSVAILAAPAASAQRPRGEWVALPEPAAQQLAEHRRIDAALAALKPQRPGVVDAYVIVVALDGDPVFGREAREAGRVLANRFDAVGHTIVLASDEGDSKGDAPGSPQTLALAFARTAELMDRNEDVLVLYSTSHGEPDEGLIYKDMQRGAGIISPARLAGMLDELGFRNRLLMLQACFSGQFVPPLANSNTIVVTAAAADRSSFGCQAGNDWTFFGDALVNHAFRQPLPLDVQLRRATALISAAEERDHLLASNPQVSMGSDTAKWLDQLDAREPKSPSAPVGQSVLGLGR
ncbi:MAG: C13 family peptidase [Sphingomicrobium sp.]